MEQFFGHLFQFLFQLDGMHTLQLIDHLLHKIRRKAKEQKEKEEGKEDKGKEKGKEEKSEPTEEERKEQERREQEQLLIHGQ